MSSWMPVSNENCYGVAIHNYQIDGEHKIKLTVGECVCILRECKNWYFGYALRNKNIFGIFPRSFIHKMNPAFRDPFGCVMTNEMVDTLGYPKQPNIVSEVTSVLREWGAIWKKLYVTNNPHFKTIERKMYELIRLRSKILSGTLPVDELKEIKRIVTWNIDVGNKLLGLDMVVRDEQGNILNPECTSVIELFRHHEIATQRILTPSVDIPENISYQTSSQLYNYTFYLCVRNLVCKSGEDMELLFTLYDFRLSTPFTENFVIRWNRDYLSPESDKYHTFRALFTDLGSRDLLREKIYLVCYVIRNGSMDLDQSGKNNKNSAVWNGHVIRRPYAVAVYNLTAYFSGMSEMDEDKHHILPLTSCEKDNLEGTLKRCLSVKDFPPKDSKGHGLVISFKLLQGDIRQVREENPHLVFGNAVVVRKMGFPEVILPGDVRNDLYLTICSGEFAKGVKAGDKNIQTIVTVCNEKGISLQGGIVIGAGVDPETEYHSVVYYHEDKPHWVETFKVAVPIEEFKGCHLKFLFRHRSSNEVKDRNEKPFAFSFVKLMQEIGTTLRDKHHELLVYKVDQKKYDPMDISYLSLASTKSELVDGFKVSVPGLTLANKDYFIIYTNVCSTKLTQNVDLLGLLNWTSKRSEVADSLSALMKVGGEEVVKFLQDVLDALFNILMSVSDSEHYDDKVFRCLLHVIGLVLDRKYLHFQSVLDVYIQESFSATLAYNKFILVLKRHIEDVANIEKEFFLGMMKALKYIVRFITRSRYLFAELNDNRGQGEFEVMMKELLNSIGVMMSYKTDSTLLLQAACLKYLPSTIPDILTVFDPIKLSESLMILINNVPSGRLTKQKMMTIDDIVHSPLFLIPECRAVLLPEILHLVKYHLQCNDEDKLKAEHRRYKSKSVAKIAKVLGTSSYDILQPQDESVSQLELCIKVLSDIMDLLFKPEAGSPVNDITEIVFTILRTIIQTVISLDRESPFVGNLVSVMTSVFRQMTPHHFNVYINHFGEKRMELLEFLMNLLLVFKDLVSRPVYPKDWCEMILLQNSIILKTLRCFSHTIRDRFSSPFEHQLWNNFFHCAVSFLTQPALQLDAFTQSKRWRIISRYKDMRRGTGFEIRIMWFHLGQNKIRFIPSLVSPFLEMTLIPEEELRKATIPIFFDMMQCEFYSSHDGILDKRHEASRIKANFSEFENEMIAKLDNFVEAGSGDERYKELFHSIMLSLCENHSTMKEQGTRFVDIITRLMERLLEYRSIINDESKENRMNCIVNLLNFYSEINRKEMYIRYVNKLCALHLECDNYTEAAFTLRLHSNLLAWSDKPLSPLLRSPKYPHCETHRQLKEALYQDMVAYFDKGKMWENALSVCKELAYQYEEEIFDYCQLSTLLRRMSQFYDCIVNQLRPEPEYFRVAYYGKGFPSFLQNKVFVYRGKEYERLSDFCSRTLNQLPNAELMNKLTPPGSDILESNDQYVQINKVEPIMDERKRSLTKSMHQQILRYHRVNNIKKFSYSRPFHRSEFDGDDKNEFANLWLERTTIVTAYPLPGILRWFPIQSTETHLISPLKNAIETMEKANANLREMIISYKNDPTLPLNPLSLKLNGIVDPAVMGGINNYEKAFFTPEYMDRHPEDIGLIEQLKDLIASQIPLLNIGIQIHSQRAPVSLAPLHQRIEDQFEEMKTRIEATYGKRNCDIKFEGIRMRRHTTVGHVSNFEDRLSAASSGSLEARTLRSFVNLDTFTSTPTLARNQGKSSLTSTNSLSGSIAMFAGPVLSNSSVSPQKFGTIGSLSKKEKKEKKKRRNRTESKVSIDKEVINSIRESTGNSQWYTSDDSVSIASANSFNNMPLPPSYDFRAEMTPKKLMLRSDSEKEMRSSRPASEGSFPMTPTNTNSSLLGDKRDSFGTTDSTASEEDRLIPPPLPMKHRETECSSLMNEIEASLSSLISTTTPSTPPPPPPPPPRHIFNKGELPESIDDSPPTPPPKKPHNHSYHRNNQTAV